MNAARLGARQRQRADKELSRGSDRGERGCTASRVGCWYVDAETVGTLVPGGRVGAGLSGLRHSRAASARQSEQPCPAFGNCGHGRGGMTPTTATQQGDEERRAEFERVLSYVAERAWVDGVEEEVMAALFDVLDGAAQQREGTGP